MSLFKDPIGAQAAETVRKQRAERKANQPLPSIDSSESSSKTASPRAKHQEASLRLSMRESSSTLDSISLSSDGPSTEASNATSQGPASTVASETTYIVSSQTIPNDLKISVDQMVAAALKQAQDLKQTYDALQSSPETSDEQDSPDSGFASSPIKSGSENGKKSSPTSGEEQSSGSAEGRTASLNSGDAIVDKMVVEALKYARGHSAATTGNIPSFHGTTTGQSGGGASVHSYYSDHENCGETAPWYAC